MSKQKGKADIQTKRAHDSDASDEEVQTTKNDLKHQKPQAKRKPSHKNDSSEDENDVDVKLLSKNSKAKKGSYSDSDEENSHHKKTDAKKV